MCRHGNKSMKMCHGTKSCRVPVMFSFLILIIVVSIVVFRKDSEEYSVLIAHPIQKWNSFDTLVNFHPTVEFRNGTDFIWQIPALPKAVLFLAHGCSGRAANFWDKSPNCPNCIGLPEERLIVLHALARNFAVLTISSAAKCWSFGGERLIAKDIIRWWVDKNKLEKLPLVALGASSGGYFVSALATDLKFSSITLMIAEGLFDKMDVMKDYPPTLFVHMPKDRFRKERIDEYIVVLRNKGIDAAEIICMEIPLSPNFLADRIPSLDQTSSMRLFELFQRKGFIDKNGYMMNDGRATRWRNAVRENKILLLDKSLVPHIQEELNLAYAYHEMTSLPFSEILDWFESHMS